MNQYINSQTLDQKATSNLPNLTSTSINNGNQFHLVMQQIGLGIPVDNLLAQYPQLKKWVDTASQYLQIPGNKQWNVNLSHKFNQVYLIENYDFIATNDDKVTAIDWTISKPQQFNNLFQSWKTQLRLFLMHENTGIKCENISLIYIFVNDAASYQCCYSQKQHEENKEKLNVIIPQKTQQTSYDSLLKIHEDWLEKNITTTEYIDRIPEVEI